MAAQQENERDSPQWLLLLLGAEKGDVDSQYFLGVAFQQGALGAEQNFDKAAYWWHKAANAGHTKALFNLGVCYQTGQGVDTDMGKAIEFFEKAAARGLSEAQFNLGYIHEHNQGTPKSKEETYSSQNGRDWRAQ